MWSVRCVPEDRWVITYCPAHHLTIPPSHWSPLYCGPSPGIYTISLHLSIFLTYHITPWMSVSWAPHHSNPSSPSHFAFLTHVTVLLLPDAYICFTPMYIHHLPEEMDIIDRFFKPIWIYLRSSWYACNHPAVNMVEKSSCIHRTTLYTCIHKHTEIINHKYEYLTK